MSSAAASITCLEQFGTAGVAPYALSKAGMNWTTVYVYPILATNETCSWVDG